MSDRKSQVLFPYFLRLICLLPAFIMHITFCFTGILKLERHRLGIFKEWEHKTLELQVQDIRNTFSDTPSICSLSVSVHI